MNSIYIRRLAVAAQQLADRARTVLGERNRQRGASAVEWVVISAVVLVIVLGIAAILKVALEQGATNVGNTISSNTQ